MRFIRFFLLFISLFLQAQKGFEMLHEKKKITIPFRQINNLIFLDLKINNVPLTFLLDTGVEETLLFSLENKEIAFENIEKIKFTGLGGSNYIEGLKSTHNQVVVDKNFADFNHDLYIILDEDFNFSSHVGIPVNGIIGYHFFKNHLVQIDFNRHQITIYKSAERARKKLKKFETLPLSIEGQKPYLTVEFKQTESFASGKMLVDLGNSDAMWLFPNRMVNFSYPRPFIEDFLGRGFNGDIYGKRSRIHQLKIGSIVLEKPIVALPNLESIQSMSFTKDRIGSIGSDVLKRFVIAFDYEHQTFYFKKTSAVKEPFKLNMSGLDIKHDGMKWEKDLVRVEVPKLEENNREKGNKIVISPSEFQYKFVLKPEYSIAGVRENSPGFLAGFRKGDQILEINRKKVSEMELQEINEILMSEENKTIKLKIIRNTQTINKEITLKDPIPYEEG